MKNEIIAVSNATTMTSLEIASLTGKEHRNVMRDIRNMMEALGVLKTEQSYLNEQNKPQPMFALTKDETLCLVSGYDPRLRMAIIKRWGELEAKAAPMTLPDFTNPVEAARAWANEVEQKQIAERALMVAAPKVEWFDKYGDADGLFSFRQVAKLLGINERDFRAWLVQNGVMYKSGRDWMVYAQHINAQRFECKTGTANGFAFITNHFTSKGVAWVSAELKKSGYID